MSHTPTNAKLSPTSKKGLDWHWPDSLMLQVETPRLMLRPYVLADIEPLYDEINASREHLLPWLPWAHSEHKSIESTTQFVASQLLSLRDTNTCNDIVMGIFDKTNMTLLGGTGLHHLYRHAARAEIGYWIGQAHSNQGFVTEATAHLISFALRPQTQQGMGLHRIEIFCAGDNTRSAAIPKRLGLPQELCQKQSWHIEGHGITDKLGWGVLANQWDCQSHCMHSSTAS